MTYPPTPTEPTIHTLKQHASAYEQGVKAFLGNGEPISETILIRQGMSPYLWDAWGDYDVDYPRLQGAVGDAGYRIEDWADGQVAWPELIQYIRDRLS